MSIRIRCLPLVMGDFEFIQEFGTSGTYTMNENHLCTYRYSPHNKYPDINIKFYVLLLAYIYFFLLVLFSFTVVNWRGNIRRERRRCW